MSAVRRVQVLVVGAGQAGLAAGYYLRRAGLDFALLDASPAPGGAWQHYWDSLRLFSPAAYASLPGRPMPAQAGQAYPDAGHVARYLAEYEKRYELPVHRPVQVQTVGDAGDGGLLVRTDDGSWHARALISATGTWSRPFVPAVLGRDVFAGRQLHTHGYRRAEDFAGQRVVVVGGGNSGAQIAADLTSHASEVRWVTRRPARFLPDEIDGRALFEIATRRVQDGGPRISDLGDIVATGAVRAARDAGRLTAHPMFDHLTAAGPAWADGTVWPADAVIWCTGFRPALAPLAALGLRGHDGRIPTDGTRARADHRVHLLGYGDWTGPASATLIGVGRTARTAVAEIAATLRTVD
ncbi:ArsO family NAD(P)H-dependent flavin-containing monooxygenase [Kitasatospora cinereorecta]|uniref:ArsO family NAD(P)H-dependent flavin-containing monooxygenase n=1 Tax=Kitasatospora cinereorecta TaxID=285560 RepID=A0ABW0V638_9ACTN